MELNGENSRRRETEQLRAKIEALSDDQLDVKIAKHFGWKLANGKWWHDDFGDGPPRSGCKAFGRKYVVAALLDAEIFINGHIKRI